MVIFHTFAYTWSRPLLVARFSEKFFTFCKGVVGISFEFNCHAAIVKVHLLFRNSGTPLFPLNFVPRKFQLAGPLPFPSLSIAYYDRNYIRIWDFRRRRTSIPIACHFAVRAITPHITFNITSFPIYPHDGTFFTRKLIMKYKYSRLVRVIWFLRCSKRHQCLIINLIKSYVDAYVGEILGKHFYVSLNIESGAAKLRYLSDVSLMSIPVTLTRAFLDRLGGTLALMNGPHQRMTLSWPSGSWHGTHGPRITNWGPNRGKPAPWPLYLSILLSTYIISLCPCLDMQPFDSELVSGVSNLQRRNARLHRQRASWSVCLGYVSGMREKRVKQRSTGKLKGKKRKEK